MTTKTKPRLTEVEKAAKHLLEALDREKILYPRSLNVREGIENLRWRLDNKRG